MTNATAAPPRESHVCTAIDARPPGWRVLWPLLLGPATILITLALELTGLRVIYSKPVHEVIAVVLTVTVTIAGIVRVVRTHHAYRVLLTAVAFTVFMREVGGHWMHPEVYIALGAIALWGFAWRERVMPYLDEHPWAGGWLIATAATYVLSQFIARRGVQHLVGEDSAVGQLFQRSYSSMEEVLENTAHVMLLCTILIGRHASRRPPTDGD